MAATTTHAEHFTFDGPVSVPVMVLVTLLFGGILLWSLRRESRILGRWKTLLFGTLRFVAILTVGWMLLAPAKVTIEESERRKAVAVVTDISQSMTTIDPENPDEDLKWSVAATRKSQNAISLSDRALAAVLIAEKQLQKASHSLSIQQSERVALDYIVAASKAISRAQKSLENVQSQLDEKGGSEKLKKCDEQIEELLIRFSNQNFRKLKKLADRVRIGQDAFEPGWREAIVDLSYQLVGIRKRLSQLPQLLASSIDSQDQERPQQSRISKVSNFIERVQDDLLEPLGESTDVLYGSFDKSFQWIDGTTSLAEMTTHKDDSGQNEFNGATNLTSAFEKIQQRQREQTVAAVVLISDVAHNAPETNDPRVLASEFGETPVYVIPIGSTANRRDVDLKAISAPGVVMKGDDVVIEATIQSFDCLGETIHVELMRDGETVQNRDIEVTAEEEFVKVRFNANLVDVGLQQFQILVNPLRGELSEVNNFKQFEINVTRNKINVLLADDSPRWEHRYLSQLFRRDEKINCDELLYHPRLIATGEREKSQKLPETIDDWSHYDVVILGDLSTNHFSIESQESLADYIRERAGTVILIAGDASMPQQFINQPLEELLPVQRVQQTNPLDSYDGYAFHVTEAGWEHDALMIADTVESTRIAWDFISQNAPFYGLSEFRLPKPTARTLIAASSRANVDAEAKLDQNSLLCWQPIGRGQVVYLSSPESYRLRFLRGDRLHYRFWGQMLRWAIASDLSSGTEYVAIRTDRPSYVAGQNVEVVVHLNDVDQKPMLDAALEVEARQADGSRSTIVLKSDDSQPGRYHGTFDKLKPGVYQVTPQGDDVDDLMQKTNGDSAAEVPISASFTVEGFTNQELLNTRSDRALAQQIAEITGGQVLPPTAMSEVLELTDLEPVVSEKVKVIPLWVQWKFLWIIFGCLFTEWTIRKQMGLS